MDRRFLGLTNFKFLLMNLPGISFSAKNIDYEPKKTVFVNQGASLFSIRDIVGGFLSINRIKGVLI